MRALMFVVLSGLLVSDPVMAQNPPVSSPPAATAPATQAKVEGFRSARFGTTEAQVRDAIAKDFKLSGDAVQRVEDPTERTTALIIKVDNLLPDSGPAVVAYLLGYKSKKLFRVNIFWGMDAGSNAKPEQIVGAANALRNYLLTQGYRPEGLILNRTLAQDRMLVFQGADQQGRQTELILGLLKKKAAKPDAQPEIAGASLWLSYVEKPSEPDIYRVPGGF